MGSRSVYYYYLQPINKVRESPATVPSSGCFVFSSANSGLADVIGICKIERNCIGVKHLG